MYKENKLIYKGAEGGGIMDLLGGLGGADKDKAKGGGGGFMDLLTGKGGGIMESLQGPDHDLDKLKKAVHSHLGVLKQQPGLDNLEYALTESGVQSLKTDLAELGIDETTNQIGLANYLDLYSNHVRTETSSLRQMAATESLEMTQVDAYVDKFAKSSGLDTLITDAKEKDDGGWLGKIKKMFPEYAGIFGAFVALLSGDTDKAMDLFNGEDEEDEEDQDSATPTAGTAPRTAAVIAAEKAAKTAAFKPELKQFFSNSNLPLDEATFDADYTAIRSQYSGDNGEDQMRSKVRTASYGVLKNMWTSIKTKLGDPNTFKFRLKDADISLFVASKQKIQDAVAGTSAIYKQPTSDLEMREFLDQCLTNANLTGVKAKYKKT